MSLSHTNTWNQSLKYEVILVVKEWLCHIMSLYFMNEQGYGIAHAMIYKDDKIIIVLESNGQISSGKHIFTYYSERLP